MGKPIHTHLHIHEHASYTQTQKMQQKNKTPGRTKYMHGHTLNKQIMDGFRNKSCCTTNLWMHNQIMDAQTPIMDTHTNHGCISKLAGRAHLHGAHAGDGIGVQAPGVEALVLPRKRHQKKTQTIAPSGSVQAQ